MASPATFRSPVHHADGSGENIEIADVSSLAKYRAFSAFESIGMGKASRSETRLVYSTSPGEWTVIGEGPSDAVDLTHVRAAIRVSGSNAVGVLAKLCSLDLEDRMFQDGSAARCSIAKTASELVRDDKDGTPSFLVVTSRSFGDYLFGALLDAAREFGVARSVDSPGS